MQNTESPSAAPRWIKTYLWITSAMALMFSLLAYFKPEVQFGIWPALKAEGALALSGPLGLYVARNLATAVAVWVALWSQQTSAVRTALVLRAVTDGMDCVHNALAGNPPGAGFAAAMFLIEAFAIWRLRGQH